MRLVLLVAAIVFALIVFVIGFGWWDDQVPHVTGWLGLSVACLAASLLPLPGWYDRP